MGRRGRKRKPGPRYPNGQPVKEKRPDDRVRISRQPHRRVMKKDDRSHEKAESPLGRLNLMGLINNDQFDAGQRFATIVGEYRATIEAPRVTAGSGRGFTCESDKRCFDTPEECLCARRKNRYDRAIHILWGVDQLAAKAVSRVAVHGEAIPDDWLPALVLGLDALGRWLGHVERRSSVIAKLFSAQLISRDQYLAGERFGRLAICHEEAVALEQPQDPRYWAALLALTSAGLLEQIAVMKAAGRNEEIEPQLIVHLKIGLYALTRHFALTDARGASHSRNAN